MSQPAIEVQGLEKTFRIPERRVDSIKERVLHPFARQAYRELHVLRGISFEVGRGEFFGVVGRNGSGKSTLLKILASIYRADGGRILVGGPVAPLIELGVGFNPEFSARENVILNAVMMGLSPREAERRFDAVIDFAELHDYTDLELKNYSSGMLVRLAFAVMTQVDADILLIDEVLAVGDAAFQQKCRDVFHSMRGSGKTVVLVTHDMSTVEEFCHRAMLLEDGAIREQGDPAEVGRDYLRLNFARAVEASPQPGRDAPDVEEQARVIDAWLEDEAGRRTPNVEQGEPIRLRLVVEALREITEPVFGLLFSNAQGVQVFGFNERLTRAPDEPDRLVAGERVRIAGTVENRLATGRYFVSLWVGGSRDGGGPMLQALQLLDFVVYGGDASLGIVSVPRELEVVREGAASGARTR